MLEVANVLVRYVHGRVGHVGGELFAQFLYLVWVAGELEDDMSQSCGGGIAGVSNRLVVCLEQCLFAHMIFTFLL